MRLLLLPLLSLLCVSHAQILVVPVVVDTHACFEIVSGNGRPHDVCQKVCSLFPGLVCLLAASVPSIAVADSLYSDAL